MLFGKIIGFTGIAILMSGSTPQAPMIDNTKAPMIDNTKAPNKAKAGINKSLLDEIGAGRGDVRYATEGCSFHSGERGSVGDAAFVAAAI